jgi:signal transduction histidine kinase
MRTRSSPPHQLGWLDGARVAQLLDVVPQGIAIFDTDEHVVHQNAAATMLAGTREGADLTAIVRETAPRRLDGRPYGRHDFPTARALRGEVVRGERIIVRGADAGELAISASAAPLRDAAGAIAGAIVAYQDISARRPQEEERARWTALVTHELMTPLTSAWGQVQMARRTVVRRGDGELEQPLSNAEAQLRRIARLLSDLTSAVEVESQVFPVIRAPADVVALVRGVVRRHGVDHKLTFRSSRAELVLDVDPNRIEQVMENLVANAERYTERGGAIAVTLGQRSLDDAVRIRVRDTGIGVPRADRPTIFGPFSRGSNVGDRTGSGLGLYISRLIARRHGGDLVLEPASVGATFTLVLPARAA